MSRITALFVGIAALAVISTVAEAADGCGRAGITMGDGACRRTNPATDTGVITARLWIADRSCGLISAAAETRRDTPRRIRALKRGTTARRTSRFRMGCASRTGGVRPPD
jgi:hypothetical protein